MFIYFDKDIVRKTILRFYQCLEPGGLLVLGHSESGLIAKDYFTPLEKTIYRKQLTGTMV